MSKIENNSYYVSGVSKFMSLIAEGLKNPKAQVPYSTKDKSLGDRSTYIGASSATGCLYKAYLDVMEINTIDAKQVFVFERGHQLEEMIRKGLNGLGWTEIDAISDYRPKVKSLVHQEEVFGTGNYAYLKAHIDFVFVTSKELVIKEIKSAATIPTEAYLSHIYQTTLQMYMLQQKYPDHKIRASVVYHNWETGESFDYPVKLNEAFLQIALKQAETLWNAIQTKTAPEPEIQLYCSKCSHKDTCSKLLFGAETELPEELTTFVERLFEQKQESKSMTKLKDNLLAYLESAGLKRALFVSKRYGQIFVEVTKGQYGFYLKII